MSNLSSPGETPTRPPRFYGLAVWVSIILVTATGCEPRAIAGGAAAGNASEAATDNVNNIDLNDAGALEGDIAKASYLIGFSSAKNIVGQTSGAVDLEAYLEGVTDAVQDRAVRVDPAQQEVLFAALQAEITRGQEAASADVIAAGKTYREAYAQKDGVTTLPSGLMYEVIASGEGAKPKLTDTVTTHYHGQLIDGTVFDSSVQRGTPASFPVNGVIKGWTEALQLMNVGSKWRLVIPPELAYGERGAGSDIKPHATLVFEVELLSIQ